MRVNTNQIQAATSKRYIGIPFSQLVVVQTAIATGLATSLFVRDHATKAKSKIAAKSQLQAIKRHRQKRGFIAQYISNHTPPLKRKTRFAA